MGSTDGNGGETSPAVKTAGIIVIGDEVLKGQVVDVNSGFIAKELYELGVKLKRISVIPDLLSSIATEVRDFSEKFDYVFTTGGIGPTHDDLTYVGVGKAFNEPISVNGEMVAMLEKWLSHKGYGPDLIQKMAQMPSTASLIFDTNLQSSFPIVVVRNVYIFPGIPQYLQRIWPRIRPLLGSRTKFHAREVYLDSGEMEITNVLNEAVAKFSSHVNFGSYPVIDNLYYSTRITLDSENQSKVEEAEEFLRKNLPEEILVNYDPNPLSFASKKIYSIVSDPSHPFHHPVAEAVKVLEEALSTYGLEGLCICFNGGKDCTVLLHLFYAVIQQKFPFSTMKLNALEIKYADPFPEMQTFIADSVRRYNLNLWTVDGPIEAGLRKTLTEHPEVKAMLMGTRRCDPSGAELKFFSMTDPTWPEVMRVSPLLHWDYALVWKFLRSHTLPYCSIYDKG